MQGKQGKLRRSALIVLSTASLLSLTACGAGTTENREVIGKSGQELTVMDNTSESIYTELKLEGIDKVDGLRGMDWITEDQIAADKENKTLPPQMIEGRERYPHNLYRHELSSGEENPLITGEKSYGFGVLSPDKKHLFYKEVYESTGIGYIMNLETGVSVKTGNEEFMADEGVWVDNEHVIYPNMQGNIVRADVNGNREIAVDTGLGYVHNVVQSGTVIYYIGNEDSQLTAYDTETGQAKVLKKNVLWIIPSPEGTKLAIVRRIGPGEMKLVICDEAGNEQSDLASAVQIFGTSWSPDGSKLAYTTMSENDNENRLFITEVATGEQTPISNDMKAADKLRWSPSGKKLLVSAAVLVDNQYSFITYIIKLS